ncbi:MAG: sigma-70 family RNA polymerase sigma factor [Bacteroidales bacterium]|nr:sigma-70 family RNA polymerase sigma factor [Bacteroidales bacterium]
MGYIFNGGRINTLDKKAGYTDDDLVKGIRSKENAAFKYIIKHNLRPVKQYILLNNGSETDANDIFQESLIILYRKVNEPGFKLTSSLGTYQYSIAKLLWLKELSRRTRKHSAEFDFDGLEDEDETISELIDKNERLKLYRQKYEELSSDCKKVLKMFLMKIPLAEITKIMGYSSEQHTRNRRYRCKESLIKRIRESEEFKELGYENNSVN